MGERDICDRFIIPEKLYGRESEVAELLATFDEEYIQDLLAHLEYYQKCYQEPVPEVSYRAEYLDL